MNVRSTRISIGDGYVVRTLLPADADALARHANNRRVWLNLRDYFPHPYRREDAENFIAGVEREAIETSFTIAGAEEAFGVIGFTVLPDVHCRTVEVGYWLGETYWGRGIATRALVAVCAHIFQKHDFVRISSSVFGWNSSSARVLEKAGFTREGTLKDAVCKDGRITDLWMYGKLRG